MNEWKNCSKNLTLHSTGQRITKDNRLQLLPHKRTAIVTGNNKREGQTKSEVKMCWTKIDRKIHKQKNKETKTDINTVSCMTPSNLKRICIFVGNKKPLGWVLASWLATGRIKVGLT